MKNRLAPILFIACILFANVVTAQISVAPEAGFNISGVRENGVASDNNIRFTGKAGAIVEVQLYKNFYLQPGLFYSMEGESVTDYVLAENYLQVPVNLIYKIGKKKDYFFVGLGLYAGYAISDKLISSSREKLPIGNSKQDDLKPFDFGGNVRVGHQLSNGLFLAGQYSFGSVNTYPGNGYTEKNWVISVTAGYFFHLKHKKEIVIPTTF